jgi:DNA-binding GntR family transcriptional regulator
LGAVVRELDFEELVELYDIRQALEPLAIRRATARITKEQLAAAETLARTMGQERDPAAWAALNHAFHRLLEEAAEAPFIESVLKGVRDVAAIYVAHTLINEPSRISSGNEEHFALLAAMREGDGNAAASILVAHLESTLQSVLKVRSGNGSPQTSFKARRSGDRDADGPSQRLAK